MNYKEAVEYLYGIPRFTKKPGLEHTKRLLEILGVYDHGKKIIHVAGTNGKGSVCTYINEVLIRNGKHTGLFTSPHLVKPNERIKIDGRDISDEDFLKYFLEVYKAQEQLASEGLDPSTFFEFVLGMAMCAFAKAEIEYIVLETGLGGRLDQTNVFEKPVLTVITKVGFDHMEFLGNSLEAIASEKAGIIKKNVPVVFYGGREECNRVIESCALKIGAPFYVMRPEMLILHKKTKKAIDFSLQYSYYESDVLSVQSVAEYQMENAALAYMALMALPDKLDIDGKFYSVWEGRMEEVLPSVFLDGGHNVDGIEAFINTAKGFLGKKVLLFSSVGDKEYPKMVKMICDSDVFDRYYVTKVANSRGISAKAIGEEFSKHTDKPLIVNEDICDIFNRAISEQDEAIIMCAGSLYLVGAIKELLMDKCR